MQIIHICVFYLDMNRMIIVGLLVILIFVRILIINGKNHRLTNMEKRRTDAEYLQLILTPNCTYCKRRLENLFFKRKYFIN